MFLASYKVTPNLAPLFRIGFIQNNAGGTAVDATGKAIKATYPTVSGNATSNPLIGLTYGRKVDSFRYAGFLAATIPIGGGGGGPPTPTMPGIAGAESQAVWARSAMDNAMFAVNYFTAVGGVDAADVANKRTVQAEATLFQLFRARGSDNLTASNDSTRTNSTFGLHVGYFFLPVLSVGGEVRYQRWLSTPTTGAKNDTTGVVTSTSSPATTASTRPRWPSARACTSRSANRSGAVRASLTRAASIARCPTRPTTWSRSTSRSSFDRRWPRARLSRARWPAPDGPGA